MLVPTEGEAGDVVYPMWFLKVPPYALQLTLVALGQVACDAGEGCISCLV
jgi:hypothetical protein